MGRLALFLCLSLLPFTGYPAALIEELILDAKAIQFDSQGKMAQQLEIKKIFQTKGETATHFIEPRVVLNQSDGSTWKIMAHTGKSIHAKNGHKFTKIEFSDQVKLMQFAVNKKNAIWTLVTDFLTIYPKSKTIYTLAPIRIYNKNLSISANGLSGDLKTKKMVLLNNVKTQYKQDVP